MKSIQQILWTRLCLAIAMESACAQDLPTKPVFTLEASERVLDSAITEAKRLNAPHGSFAVVDDAGYLLVFKRIDNSLPATAHVAVGKARTAAIFRMPSAELETAVNKGRISMLSGGFNVGDGFTAMKGGIPLRIGGQVIGAIGVSGAASADQDEEIAKAVVGQWEQGLGRLNTSAVAARLADDARGLQGAPLATVDLATREGVESVQGTWRYHDVKVVESDFLAAAPDGQPILPPMLRTSNHMQEPRSSTTANGRLSSHKL